MEPPSEPKISPLSRTATADGQELEILIYENRDGRWCLEVINHQGVHSTWLEPFKTERGALRAALKAIREDGADDFGMDLSYRYEVH